MSPQTLEILYDRICREMHTLRNNLDVVNEAVGDDEDFVWIEKVVMSNQLTLTGCRIFLVTFL